MSRTSISRAFARSASTPSSTTSGSCRTTGSHPRSGPGGSGGKCGSTGWRSPSSPTSRKWGGIELNPISAELTYGTERIAMYLQGVDNVFDLLWTEGVTYGDIHHEDEVQFSK